MESMDLESQNVISKPKSLAAKLLKDHEYSIGYDFNCILVGKLFDADQNKLLIGTTQGKIHVFFNGKEEDSLETKGSGIVSMCIHDVTKFGWTDLIVGDSLGNTTLFSRKEILGRHDFGASITSICVDKVTSNIIVGDRQGCLHCFVPPFDILWNTASLDNHNPSLNTQRISGGQTISTTQTATQTTVESSVKCCTAQLVDTVGNLMNTLLVSDGSPFLHFYNQSLRVYSLLTPTRITSICCGLFQTDNHNNRTQVALGCENGFIYLVKDYQLKPFITVGNYITSIQSMVKPTVDCKPPTHMLLCAGHFNALNVYIEDKLALSIETEDWVHTFHVGDINNDLQDEVVIGTVNNTIRAYVLQNL